jgi:hypothetical protein
MNQELTGGKVNYYLVQVEAPQREEQPPYQAECEDIIQALGMTFDEGCLFKALWRNANARKNNGKPGQSAKYDAEKMVHYAGRILKQESRQNNISTEQKPKIIPNITLVTVVYKNGETCTNYAGSINWNNVVKWEVVNENNQ